MIKIFRTIRQRLLKENRISKYLLYAFGEIVLVVIGIMIALQINNANQKRLDEEALQGYLNSIAQNVDSDLKKAKKIKTLRAIAGLTQEELAQKVNVRRETIVFLEKGKYNPSLKLAYDIARVFDKPIEEVFLLGQ